MPIRRSSAREAEELISRLAGSDEIQRVAAIARLRVIGPRAIPHLIDAARSASAPTRHGALQALEALPDRRSIAPLVQLLGHDDTATAAGAAAALRPLIATTDEREVIDALVAAVTDARRDARVRHAALRALAALGPVTLGPLLEHMGGRMALDPDLRRAAERGGAESHARARLPDDPTAARRMFAAKGAALSIAELHDAVATISAREAAERQGVRRLEWMTARAVVHQRLAERGSRVALYDLRETLERADGPLPVEFLSAVETIGDAECAAAVAAAFARAAKADWWSDHLAAAFRAIVKRERITRRNAAIQRVARKWPEDLDRLLAPAASGRKTRRPQNSQK